jgi:hypothetical protein
VSLFGIFVLFGLGRFIIAEGFKIGMQMNEEWTEIE